MLLIHRSIFIELLGTFLLSVLFLNFALMMEKLLRLSRLLAGVGASLYEIGKIILCLQPQIMMLTIPMGILLSVLLVYGRMNADNEWVILKSAGMSFRSISLPVFYLGMAGFGLSLILSFYLGPRGGMLIRQTITDIITSRAAMALEEGVFNTSFKDMVILVKQKPAKDRLSGVFILDERKKDEQRIITAQEGRISADTDALSFMLGKGSIAISSAGSVTDIQFGSFNFKLDPLIDSPGRKNSELVPSELLQAARDNPDKKVVFMLEFYRRLSMPAICLIIILLGPSVSLLAGKSGRMGGLAIGLGVFGLYYAILIYGENLARSGKLAVFAGSWLSPLILGAFSIFIFERVNKR